MTNIASTRQRHFTFRIPHNKAPPSSSSFGIKDTVDINFVVLLGWWSSSMFDTTVGVLIIVFKLLKFH